MDELNKKEETCKNIEFSASSCTKKLEAKILDLEQELEKIHNDFIKLDLILNQRESHLM